MGYSFMTFEKIKDKGTLTKKYEHNYRIGKVLNADPALANENEELVKLNGKTYVEAFNERINELKETNKKIRKNAVYALEVVTTFSREELENVDIEEWKRDQVKWLEENFNANPEKYGNNVISVMFHGDEAGCVHCHSIIIPIDDKGALNASYYTDGREKVRHLQDTYGNMMEMNHNLQRGLQGSVAKHQDIKRFYAAANQALAQEGPEIRTINGRKETVEEYKKRTDEIIKDLHLKMLNDKKAYERALDVAKTLNLKEKVDFYSKKKKFEEEKGIIEGIENLEEVINKAKTMDVLSEGLNHFPDKEKASMVFEGISEIISFERSRESEIKKQNKK